MPVVLDTDHLSILQWREQPACDRLLKRLATLAPDDIATTIVCFQEQVQYRVGHERHIVEPQPSRLCPSSRFVCRRLDH